MLYRTYQSASAQPAALAFLNYFNFDGKSKGVSRMLCLAMGCVLGLALGYSSPAWSQENPLEAAKVAAEKAREDQAAANKAVTDAKARAEKAAAEVTAAQKAVADMTAKANAAAEVLRAQETYAADKAVVESRAALVAAEKTAREAAAAYQKAVEELEKAKAANDAATAEKVAAEEAAQKAPADDKQAADSALTQKVAACEDAQKKLQTARAAVENAVADKAKREAEVVSARESIASNVEWAAQAKARAMGGLKPLAANQWSYEKARHLLFRAGLGGPPEEVARLHAMGLFAAVDYLVDYHLQAEPAGWFDAFPHRRTAPYERHLNEAQRAELNQARVTFRWDQHHRLRKAWLQRMVETERPLQEKLTLFWHGHFACSYLPAEDSFSMWQQNEMFRRRASGNFGALLHGIAHDPAMIRYLDNNVNFKGSGNENLGREILELFSMGEGQGYTEQDLAEAARALTGYNFEYHNGQFKFIASRHDSTEKTLFGKKGNFGGDELVDLILQQPATSRYITAKLYRFFAHDNPDAETIETMASLLRSYDYEMQPMLRNFFGSEEFYSEQSMGNHIKSPIELVIGAVRTLKLDKVDYNAIDSTVSGMGQRVFEPPNVAGWEGGRAWIDASSLLLRYNALGNLVEQADLVTWLQTSGATDPAATVDHLARAFLCVPLSDPKRQELIAFLGQLPPPDQWAGQRAALNSRLRSVLVALVSLPEYQLAAAAKADQPYLTLAAVR